MRNSSIKGAILIGLLAVTAGCADGVDKTTTTSTAEPAAAPVTADALPATLSSDVWSLLDEANAGIRRDASAMRSPDTIDGYAAAARQGANDLGDEADLLATAASTVAPGQCRKALRRLYHLTLKAAAGMRRVAVDFDRADAAAVNRDVPNTSDASDAWANAGVYCRAAS